MTPSPLAIIHIQTSGKNFSTVNYSRRIYAVIRKYTPEVVEGKWNECFADITGLRTFYQMTYKELVSQIIADLKREIGVSFTVRVTTRKALEGARFLFKRGNRKNKEPVIISTYKEMNGFSLLQKSKSTKQKFAIPFLGKVA